jgi:hypothetical protein
VAELTVIRWRDIPAQIVARGDDGSSARRLFPDEFQEAVDAAAMVAGLIDSEDYMTNFVQDRRPCGDDLEAEAQAELDRLSTEWTPEMLRQAVRAGGVKGGEDVAGQSPAVRPSPEDA